MKTTPHERRIPVVIDIETAADMEWIERTRQAFIDQLEPPANYRKPDTIERWIQEQVDGRVERAPLSPVDGKITAWACASLWGEDEVAAVVNREDEATLIRKLLCFLQVPCRAGGIPLISGWRINGFDVPFITARAAVHGIQMPTWWPANPRRHGATLDGADLLSEGRLALWLERFGLPPKLGDGADAPHLDDVALLDYVRNDVHVERLLLRRLALVSPEIAGTNPLNLEPV